jgi:preprotein translocase subunit SecB
MTDASGASPESQPSSVSPHSLPLVIHAQYVKDISFESPSSPNALRPGQENPRMDVNINLDARALEDTNLKNLYEVVLKLSARAERKDYTVFVAELHYGITVSLPEVPEAQHHPLLLIEVPKLAFPFARKILGDLTQDGGFPPLLLGPVDFYGMYMARFGKKAEAAAKAAN